MDTNKGKEIAASTLVFAKGCVQAQIKAGSPNYGMPQARQASIAAQCVVEALASYAMPAEYKDGADKWQVRVIRAALDTALLNASALRQKMEDAEIFIEQSKVKVTEYDC